MSARILNSDDFPFTFPRIFSECAPVTFCWSSFTKNKKDTLLMMTHNDVISAHSSITPYDAMNLDDFIRVTFGRVMTLDDVISLSLFFFFFSSNRSDSSRCWSAAGGNELYKGCRSFHQSPTSNLRKMKIRWVWKLRVLFLVTILHQEEREQRRRSEKRTKDKQRQKDQKKEQEKSTEKAEPFDGSRPRKNCSLLQLVVCLFYKPVSDFKSWRSFLPSLASWCTDWNWSNCSVIFSNASGSGSEYKQTKGK